MNCAWFELFRRFPFSRLRLPLSRWHVNRCPRCRGASESGEALPPILVTAGQLPPGIDLWPAVREKIMARREPAPVAASASTPARREWRWGYAAAALALLMLAGLWVLFFGRRSLPPAPPAPLPAPQVRLCSAKAGDRPARVIQFQSRNPDRSIYWIARDDPRS